MNTYYIILSLSYTLLSHVHLISFIVWMRVPHPPPAKSLPVTAHSIWNAYGCIWPPSRIHWISLIFSASSKPCPKKPSAEEILSPTEHSAPNSFLRTWAHFKDQADVLFQRFLPFFMLKFLAVWHVLTALQGQSELETKVTKGHD